MNSPASPPAWVPTLTEEIVVAHAAEKAKASVTPAIEIAFPSELDEARLCMLVTDRLMAQLPDLIRAAVRDVLLQQTATAAPNDPTPHDPTRQEV